MKSFLLLALAATLFSTALADTGALIRRTVHDDANDASTDLVQGGSLLYVPFPASFDQSDENNGTQSWALGFWVRRSDDGGNPAHGTLIYLPEGDPPQQSFGDFTVSSSILGDDFDWHYVYLSVRQSDSGAAPISYASVWVDPEPGDAPVINDQSFSPRYESGPTFNGVVLGATSFNFIAGPRTLELVRRTSFSAVIDDITFWTSNSAAVRSINEEIYRFGDGEIPDPANTADLHAYYSCEGPANTPPFYLGLEQGNNTTLNNQSNVATARYVPVSNVPLTNNTDDQPNRFLRINVTSEYGATPVDGDESTAVQPNAGETIVANGTPIQFSSPRAVYLDRFMNEVPAAQQEDAFYRALPTSAVPEGESPPDLITLEEADRVSFNREVTSNITLTWNWKLQYAVFVETATAALEGLDSIPGTPTLDVNGQSGGSLEKYWIDAGSTISALIANKITASSGSGGIKFTTTGFTVENVLGDNNDRSLYLGGSNDSALVSGRAPLPDFTDFTIEFWINRDDIESNRVQEIVRFTNGQSAPDTRFYRIGFRPTTHATNPGGLFFQANPGFIRDVGNSRPPQEWQHWALTYDATARELKAYRNAALLQTFTNLNLDFDSIVQNGVNATLYQDNGTGGIPPVFGTEILTDLNGANSDVKEAENSTSENNAPIAGSGGFSDPVLSEDSGDSRRPGNASSWMEWNNVNAGAGERYIAIRYRIPADAFRGGGIGTPPPLRDEPIGELRVNGTLVGTVEFVETGDSRDGTFAQHGTVVLTTAVNFNAGNNTIRLDFNNATQPFFGAGLTIDQIGVYPAQNPPTFADAIANWPQSEEGTLPNFTFGLNNPADRFAYEYEGFLFIKEAGDYTFTLNSDDGALLYLDGTLILDNDGLHGASQTAVDTITLERGYHPIRVEYYEATASQSLTLRYSGPDTNNSPTTLPDSVLFTGLAGVNIGNNSGSTGVRGGINNLRLWTTALEQSEIDNAKSTAAFGEDTSDLAMEFTFDEILNNTITSNEGRVYLADLLNTDDNFPADATDEQKLAALNPAFGITTRDLQSIPNEGRYNSGSFTVNDWIRISWSFQKTFVLNILTSPDTAPYDALPFLIRDPGGPNEQRFEGSALANIEIPENENITVGTQYRVSQFPVCSTLSSITSNGFLGALNDETVLDGTGTNGLATRETTLRNISDTGRIVFNYSGTIYRAEVALGEFLDASSLTALNDRLVPDLCPGAQLDLVNGPTGVIERDNSTGSQQLTDPYIWDAVGQRIVPLSPGIFTLSWPDALGNGTTHYVQITTHLPQVEISPLPYHKEDPANPGFRLGSHPDYVRNTMIGDLSDAYPGSPRANYRYLYPASGEFPPVDLDANASDRWNFERITYTNTTDIIVPQGQSKLTASGPGRAVLLYTYRPDPAEVANGDTTREAYAAFVVETEASGDNAITQDTLSSGTRRAFYPNETDQLFGRFDENDITYGLGSDVVRTFEFWAKLDETVNDETIDRVAWEASLGSGTPHTMRLGFRGRENADNPGAFFLEVFRNNTPQNLIVNLETPTDAVIDSGWHHWAVVFDSGQQRIFLDGNLVAIHDGALTFTIANDANDHSIGYSAFDSGNWFNGLIDNLAIWAEAADATAIRQMMLATRFTDADGANLPLHLSRFDEAVTGSRVPPTYAVSDGDFRAVDRTDNSTTDPSPVLALTDEDTFPEVATRLLSRLDTARFRTGFILNSIGNFNANVYDRTAELAGTWGPIFPVNFSKAYRNGNTNDTLEILYYQNPYLTFPLSPTTLHPNVAWPGTSIGYDDIDFPANGENKDQRIYIASRLGSEGVDLNGDDQLVYDPSLYEELSVYNQPDPTASGYNPNEEHALIAPSIKTQLTGDATFNLGQDAAFALQNDLNTRFSTNTSEPWVLTQFLNKETGEWEMEAYKVEKTRSANPAYQFRYSFNAGDIVVQPYPLNLVVGNVIMKDDTGGNVVQNGTFQRTLWFDKNEIGWVVSGDGLFHYRFWYPFRADFWYDPDRTGTNSIDPGTPIAWVPTSTLFINNGINVSSPTPRRVLFDTFWDDDYPKLKRGESITFQGGENKAENPLDEGLPAILAMASAEVVYDSNTPTMQLSDQEYSVTNDSLNNVVYTNPVDAYSARITRPLDRYEADMGLSEVPADLQPAAIENVQVVAERWYFKSLVGSLQKRFYYDSLRQKLVLRGRVNDKESGDPDLTVVPVALSIIEPNAISQDDYEALVALQPSNSTWTDAVEAIYLQSQNPAGITPSGNLANPNVDSPVFYAGLQDSSGTLKDVPFVDVNGTEVTVGSIPLYEPLMSLGTGAALVPNPLLLTEDTDQPFYLTIAENNNPALTGAVALHIIEIIPDRFRGAIKAIEAQNVFDDKINIAHTGDFGGNTANIFYEWYIRDSDTLNNVGIPGEDNEWQLYTDGLGQNIISFSGRPDITLADKLFFVRYGEVNELGDITGESNSLTDDPDTASVTNASWRLVDINAFNETWERAGSSNTGNNTGGPVPFQWAGASNSPQLQADGSKKYIPQLVLGWVKRVLDRINPYEARFTDFFNNESPATYSSQIQIAGAPFIGKVALNADKNVIENVGLIELYETVLARARELTLDIPGNSDANTNQAILLAATRLAFLYELLAREAYSDAQNPLVPVSDENGLVSSAPFIHAFQDQEASLLHEELALLRGTDFLKAYPAFNRLFWNYVKGTGEAAYNAVYNITDSNTDGFINEFDGAQQYPQGHGDAWGHFLSANNMHYNLLNNLAFEWDATSELYSLLDNVIEVDYLDEKSFARIAAAKARTGAEIVRATYREAYVEDPDGQWQGYTDTIEPARAWGVSEWSKRTGQAALFDWAVANAVVPLDADDDLENLDQIDRNANKAEISEIAGALVDIQNTLDSANSGANPVALDPDAVVFDLDPLEFSGSGDGARKTHFEQVYDRAVMAAQNAVSAHEFASVAEKQLRKVTDDTIALQVDSVRQDVDFRNRLIEIFGRPYDGNIGPGQVYPEGYQGPDTLLYLYVDRVESDDLIPNSSTLFTDTLEDFQLSSVYVETDFINNNFLFKTIDDYTIGDSVQDIFNDFYLTPGVDENGNETEPGPPGSSINVTFDAPVRTETSDWAFAVPDEDENGVPDWGRRSSYGKIQVLINELLQEEIALDTSIRDYQAYMEELAIRAKYLEFVLGGQRRIEEFRERGVQLVATGTVVRTIAQLVTSWQDWVKEYAFLGAEALETSLPNVIGAGTTVITDPSFIGRSAFRLGGIAIGKSTEFGRAIATAGDAVGAGIIELAESNVDDQIIRKGERQEILAIMTELATFLRGEESKRLAIAAHAQQMLRKSHDLQTTLAEGFRLLDEREAFNMTVASKAQRNRYSDMVSRLSRNESLTQYQSAYDNALRYAWLAAKAYDYETSLDPGDPAAATTFLESIIKERQLGNWTSGQPQLGNGGLAEILAQMKTNFESLKGQLGINNPQLETGLLSLRHEHFRIARDSESSDQRWNRTLKAARIDDLRALPEFRKYCRPFAPESAGAQPALVIDFSTEINSGFNIFGQQLGGQDHAYSSSNFATKLSSLGVWFEGYNHTNLSTTPRVYLVPVGNDILRTSNSTQFTERRWNVLEQRIPAPFIINNSELNSPSFIPSAESLNGSFADLNRFGDFRAYHTEGGDSIDASQLHTSSRLIGRSVWNTRWLLIIPGATLHADPNYGLKQFINGVDDIKLQFETYTHEGN